MTAGVLTGYRSALTSMRSLLPIAALLTAAGADAEIYKELGDGWAIQTLEDGCFASAAYQGDKLFMVNYYPRGETVRLTMVHPDATSLEDGAVVELYVKFVIGNSLDNGWGQQKFDVGVLDGGERFITSSFESYDMLRDIARADKIAFTLDEDSDRIIAVFDLSGTSAMVKVLRECSLKVVGLNPEDPFVG
jgi:hypothetical protein